MFGTYDDTPREQALVSSFRNLLHHHVHTSNAGSATTFWAGVGAVRREAFVEVGGFDDQLITMEDVEFGARLHAAGYPDRARSGDPGHAPEALDAHVDGEDGSAAPRRTVGRPGAERPRRSHGIEPRLAPSHQRARQHRPRRLRRQATAGRRRRFADHARSGEPLLLQPARQAARPARGRRGGRPARRCIA